MPVVSRREWTVVVAGIVLILLSWLLGDTEWLSSLAGGSGLAILGGAVGSIIRTGRSRALLGRQRIDPHAVVFVDRQTYPNLLKSRLSADRVIILGFNLEYLITWLDANHKRFFKRISNLTILLPATKVLCDERDKVRRTYGYDTGTRRLTSIAANTDLTPGGSTQTLFSSTLTYSNDGNITDLATSTTTSGSAVNQTQCFNYDDYSRLTVAWTRNNVSGGTCNHTTPNPDGAGTDPYYQEYLYEFGLGKTNTLTGYFTGTTVGNKVSKDLDFESPFSPHAVTDIAETIFYEINANGSRHRQNGEPTANSYHRTNQLKKLVDNVSLTTNEYAYDNAGMRIAQKITPNAGSTVTASTTIYLEGQELTWTGSATVPTVDRYYQIPGGPTLALRKQTNTISWLFNDHQQTNTNALQQNQTIPTTQRYLPFGQTRGTNNTLPTQHGFLGKTEDDTTRTVHTDHREYDPSIMQFTSVDPVVTSTAAPYNYAGGNPITLSDPSGLKVCDDPRSCRSAGVTPSGKPISHGTSSTSGLAPKDNCIPWHPPCGLQTARQITSADIENNPEVKGNLQDLVEGFTGSGDAFISEYMHQGKDGIGPYHWKNTSKAKLVANLLGKDANRWAKAFKRAGSVANVIGTALTINDVRRNIEEGDWEGVATDVSGMVGAYLGASEGALLGAALCAGNPVCIVVGGAVGGLVGGILGEETMKQFLKPFQPNDKEIAPRADYPEGYPDPFPQPEIV